MIDNKELSVKINIPIKKHQKMLEVISNTLFLAKDLDDFENFLRPGIDYEVISSRSSKEISDKYPNVFVYENQIKYRNYSTSSFFSGKLFSEDYFFAKNQSMKKYIWTYQAYQWMDDLNSIGIKTFSISDLLFTKLKNKIFQHKMLNSFYSESPKANPILKKEMELKTQFSIKGTYKYEYYYRLYNAKPFVISCPNSDGGSCVFLVKSSQDYDMAMSKTKSPVVKIERYIDDAIPVNQCGIVFADGHVICYQPSIQIIQNRKCANCFEYIGSDYNFEKLVDNCPEIEQNITRTTIGIGKFLASTGYRGIFGCDYILKDQEHYFIEINPRYQASTFLLAISSSLMENPHYLHIYSFIFDDCPAKEDILLKPIITANKSSYIKFYSQNKLANRCPEDGVNFEDNVHIGFGVFNQAVISKPFFPTELIV